MKNFILLILAFTTISLRSQITADFEMPDTVCTGEPVTIVNTSTGASTCYWNFCSGNLNTVPVSVIIGNPFGSMLNPTYITLVQDGTDCFSFITNQGFPTSVTRYYHGSSFLNLPVSAENLVQTGEIEHWCEGIQVKKDNGNWYGFVNSYSTILRLDFGPSLWNNNPVVTDLGPFPAIAVAHGLVILREGNTWLGFFDSDKTNRLFRLNFGNSLSNIPVCEDLGNLADFSHPTQISLVNENGSFFLFLINYTNNSLCRISFGTSLLNSPAGVNLGSCGDISSPHAITVLNDCEVTTGYYAKYTPGSSAIIGRLTFSGGAAGSVIAEDLGNLGDLNFPVAFSEIFRLNDNLYFYLTNLGNSSLTRYSFTPGNVSSVASSVDFSPAAFSYDQPGAYNVHLVINEGTPEERNICKSITVVSPPSVNLGNDRTICEGETTTFDAGTCNGCSYSWKNLNTGATVGNTSTLTTREGGIFEVTVSITGLCVAQDTVAVFIIDNSSIGVIYFPSAFTPDGDGLNDVFRPSGQIMENFSMEIYSRTGQMLARVTDPELGWDGKYQGAFIYGTFAWTASWNTPGSSTHFSRKGVVSVIRTDD